MEIILAHLVWFTIVRWDHPHRHVKIVGACLWTSRVPHGSWTLDVFFRSIMYIQLRVYLVFWGRSFHIVIFHCIPWHSSVLMIMCFIGGWEVLDIWLPLYDQLDLVCCWYCECLFVKVVMVEYWVCGWGCNLLKWLRWAGCYENCELFGWADFYGGCSCGGSVGV